jgi:hypothetical protein
MEAFMVRVWTAAGGERVDGVRGTALHVASSRQMSFSAAEGLIAFLTETAGEEATRQHQPTGIEPAHERSH